MERISIQKCKEYLNDPSLTDSEIKDIRDAVYAFIEKGLDFVFEGGILVVNNNIDNLNNYEK